MVKESIHITLKIELVPIEQDGVHIFIRARINGKPARFLVDTGASRTVLDQKRVLRFLKAEEAKFEKLEAASAGLGTSTMESHTIVLRSLSFSRLVLKDYKTAVLALNHVNQSYSVLKMKKIDGVIWEAVRVRALREVDRAAVERPEVNPPVGPVCEQQVQGTASRAQVIARTKLRTTALKRFLNRVVQIEVKRSGAGSCHDLILGSVVIARI